MSESEQDNTAGSEWAAEQIKQQAGRIASADQARMYATFYRTLIENGVKPTHASQITCAYMRVLAAHSMGSR